ncbi:MAG: SDR family oxidoreductase [Gemmatimonadaceae bacterium]
MHRTANHRELQGRVALVTGVTRRAGIGAAIAQQLAHAGADLFVTFFRNYDQTQPWGLEPGEPHALIEELANVSDVSSLELDLSSSSAPRELVDRVVAHFGRLDILVNNAAHSEAGTIDHVDAAQLDRHYAVNTRATVLLCAEFARQAATDGRGRIINITSGQGRGPMPGELAYVVTKGALDALTLTLSVELAHRNITVNAIDPGPTDTGWISEEHRTALAGRISSPVEVARLVRMLASDAAASITGQIIRVEPGKEYSTSEHASGES